MYNEGGAEQSGLDEVRFLGCSLGMFSILSFLPMFSSSENDQQYDSDEVGGASAVNAALEAQQTNRALPLIEFGEPRLVDRGVKPVNDFYVLIPTFSSVVTPDIEFELPNGPYEDDSELQNFLEKLGVDGVEDVAGTEVRAKYEDGAYLPDYDS